MNHNDLVQRAENWLRNTRRCRVTAKELSAGDAQEIPDAIGWTYRGNAILVECKVSLSDFKHDKYKIARNKLADMGVGRQRYYFVSKELSDQIKDEAIPEEWGLAVVHAKQVRIRKEAPQQMLSNESHRREKIMLGAMAQRALMAVEEEYCSDIVRAAWAKKLVKPFTTTDEIDDNSDARRMLRAKEATYEGVTMSCAEDCYNYTEEQQQFNKEMKKGGVLQEEVKGYQEVNKRTIEKLQEANDEISYLHQKLQEAHEENDRLRRKNAVAV